MRLNILHEGAHFLEYEIRQIVEVAHKMQTLGAKITWENIGDPIAMGEKVDGWIVDIVKNLVNDSYSWAYCDTRGVPATREFLAAEVNKRGGCSKVSAENILFFNGVADAIDKVYELVHRNARILLPTPVYSTHSSNEAKRGGYESLFFHLDPQHGWLPDLEEIRLKVKYNPSIAGIGLINPDNPTGFVYPRAVLEEIIAIAREYDLFLICDETYIHISYNGEPTCHISSLVGDEVKAIVMRGISKEYPWPGARCAWIELLNVGKDPNFTAYTKSLLDAKRLEVCSTTLPQMSIPLVFGNALYPAHLKRRADMFKARAAEAYDIFKGVAGLTVNKTCGAFYMSIIFNDGVLIDRQTLPIDYRRIKAMVEEIVKGVPRDKRFVYYLMGAEGICVTPLSGFATKQPGFRITLLQTDDEKRHQTYLRIAQAIKTYISS
jgi:aspartate/methionine/tyrosine aminotransferase